MNEQQLNSAIDFVIDKFIEESSKSLEYQDENGCINGFAIQQQNKAITNALCSLKNILIADKQN